MNLAAALHAELATNTTTATYLAGLAGAPNRIYPLMIPQKVPGGAPQLPAVVTALTSVERQVLYCGTSGLVRSRVNLDCYALTFDEAKELADAVRQVLQDFNGMLGQILDVRNAAMDTEIELVDIEPGIYRVSQSWAIWHVE